MKKFIVLCVLGVALIAGCTPTKTKACEVVARFRARVQCGPSGCVTRQRVVRNRNVRVERKRSNNRVEKTRVVTRGTWR